MTSRVGGPIQPSGMALPVKPTDNYVLMFKDGVWKAAEAAAPFLNATELGVANAASPTELNSYGTAVPDWRLVYQAGAASDAATLYRLDASSDAQSLPYIVDSLTSGLKWVAVAGRYCNSEETSASGFTGPHMRALSSAGLLLENSNGDDVALLGAGPGTGVTFYGGVILDAETASRIVTTGASKDLDTPAAISVGQSIATTSTITATTRIIGVGAPFSVYGVESTGGAGFSFTTTNNNGTYTVDYRRIANTSSSGAHNARSLSGSQYGTISSGQTNSGSWTGLWSECLRNYVATSDTGTLTTLEGARITVGHFSTDASTPTTTTIKGLYMPLYRSTGTIGTFYGIHIDNGSTSITPTTGYGIKIENTTGTTAYALHTGTGLVQIGDTTDSTSKDTGSIVTEGGIGAEKQITAGTGFRTGSTTLMTSSVAFTDGSGASSGTLTNAPAAGNPTKWIPVNDNGTTRYIPAW